MKWIPVGTQEPEMNQDVLVTAENRDALPGRPHFWDRFVSLARYRGRGNFAIRESLVPYNIQVTHWALLPDMPKGGPSKFRRKLLKILQG